MMLAAPAEVVTVAREDGVYCCFPDVVRAASGTLLCVFRQSDAHAPQHFSHLALCTSGDDGRSWTPPRRLIAGHTIDGVRFHWNCPRIGQLPDGRLWLLCDGFPVPPGEDDLGRARVFFWGSGDDGATWDGPHETPITGIVPDRLRILDSGDWLVAAHVQNPATAKLMQTVWRSPDAGASWQGPLTLCDDARYNVCEACLLPLPGGEIVAYLRENSGRGWPLLKCFSRDEGLTWDGPYETLVAGGHRPVAGLLPDGGVLITYRWLLGGNAPNRHFYAFRESLASARSRDFFAQSGTVHPLDYDRHPAADTGYSGWASLPDGRLFCVNYIRDDCPDAQIRGYWLSSDALFGG